MVAKLNIGMMQEIARLKGGECISEVYINRISKLRWRCKELHEWDSTPASVISGNWCLLCSNKKNKNHGNKKTSLEEIKSIADIKMGKLLSTKYEYNKKLKWQCQEGHIWESKLYHIKQGSWCPYCTHRAKSNIEEIHQLAKKNKGKCLTNHYLNAYTKVLWECERGHSWEATSGSIKSGSWCPYCSERKNERYCRKLFQEIFKTKFEKKRPTWLRSNKGNLELDGINETLGIAFEYNGKQHYEPVPYFENEQTLQIRKEYDSIKIDKCKENNISLIIIPYHIDIQHMKEYILQELKNKGIFTSNI